MTEGDACHGGQQTSAEHTTHSGAMSLPPAMRCEEVLSSDIHGYGRMVPYQGLSGRLFSSYDGAAQD